VSAKLDLSDSIVDSESHILSEPFMDSAFFSESIQFQTTIIDSESTNSSLIFGVVGGGLFLIAGVATMIFCFYRRRHHSADHGLDDSSADGRHPETIMYTDPESWDSITDMVHGLGTQPGSIYSHLFTDTITDD
jgi:hypothetical protein